MKSDKSTVALLCLAVMLNVTLWFCVYGQRAAWLNVPPVPSRAALESAVLSDSQLAFRMTGLMIQQLGDTGGRVTALADYNYHNLYLWLALMDKIDPESQFVPFMAALYFGAVSEPDKIRELIPLLADIGQRPGKERWRWLGHAVYLARFVLHDQALALDLARKLAASPDEDRPAWTMQMPAMILNSTGKREEALAVMTEILETSADKIQPNEVNFTIDYICRRILTPQEAARKQVCIDYKNKR